MSKKDRIKKQLDIIDGKIMKSAMIAAVIGDGPTDPLTFDLGIASIICLLLEAGEALTIATVELEPIGGGKNGRN